MKKGQLRFGSFFRNLIGLQVECGHLIGQKFNQNFVKKVAIFAIRATSSFSSKKNRFVKNYPFSFWFSKNGYFFTKESSVFKIFCSKISSKSAFFLQFIEKSLAFIFLPVQKGTKIQPPCRTILSYSHLFREWMKEKNLALRVNERGVCSALSPSPGLVALAPGQDQYSFSFFFSYFSAGTSQIFFVQARHSAQLDKIRAGRPIPPRVG